MAEENIRDIVVEQVRQAIGDRPAGLLHVAVGSLGRTAFPAGQLQCVKIDAVVQRQEPVMEYRRTAAGIGKGE